MEKSDQQYKMHVKFIDILKRYIKLKVKSDYVFNCYFNELYAIGLKVNLPTNELMELMIGALKHHKEQMGDK